MIHIKTPKINAFFHSRKPPVSRHEILWRNFKESTGLLHKAQREKVTIFDQYYFGHIKETCQND